MLVHLFPLLFPKDSKSLNIFDIRLWEVGAKRLLNGTSKVNGQTNTQTDDALKICFFRDHLACARFEYLFMCTERIASKNFKNVSCSSRKPYNKLCGHSQL
jgi:hypothetical protein